jgi:hypothetical protein
VGYIKETPRRGDRVHVKSEGVEGLLQEMPLPYDPPMVFSAEDRGGFEFWWRQLLYVFDLPDPRLFQPLPMPLADEQRAVVERYVATAKDLAQSGVVNSIGGFDVTIADKTNEETVVLDFPRRDLQAGFATFLRQCHSEADDASFEYVHEILSTPAASATNASRAERIRQLELWQDVVRRLRAKSLNQLVRDRIVAEEGWKICDFEEEKKPTELLREHNYGDLIHWGSERGALPSQEQQFEAAYERSEFFDAALGLAHAYIGFGELARAAVTPSHQLLLP